MAQQQLHLKIVSPEGTKFEGVAQQVVLPGEYGLFGILPKHAPLIAALNEGTIRYEAEGQIYTLPIQGGFAEVKNDNVTVSIEL